MLRQLAAERLVPTGTREANDVIRSTPNESTFAVVKPDMAFHTALIDGVGSARTSRLYRTLTSEVTLCMTQVQGRQLLGTEMIVAEHDGLLDLIAAGDGDGAAALLDIHLSRARERLVGALGGEARPEADVETHLP